MGTFMSVKVSDFIYWDVKCTFLGLELIGVCQVPKPAFVNCSHIVTLA